MTRYAKLEKKKYKEAVGFEGFNVKPLSPSKSKSSSIKKEREQTVVAMGEHGEQFKEKSKNGVKRKIWADKAKNTDAKFKRSEKRRLRRIKERKSKTICFACRKTGHSVKDCPEANKYSDSAADRSISVGLCYTCGSTEHTSKNCKEPIFSKDNKNIKYQYAKCFICGEQGHLSGKCAKNEKGLYPNGGSCRFCGKVDHFAKDCDIKKEEIGVVALSKIDSEHGPDDDDFHIFIEETKKSKKTREKSKKINTSVTSTKTTDDSISNNNLLVNSDKSKAKKKIVRF
ncbi:9176_t:CDS:2 [Ambispora gerdemannii]|uniref:9176_t:CDS:1 n=1 Tax=Ambispora gerdemannii TaxID=144530 RepID=A0A9N8WN19_9GLOM|nr:9176_t:CDS:2 [Ambispora gerdemannii]